MQQEIQQQQFQQALNAVHTVFNNIQIQKTGSLSQETDSLSALFGCKRVLSDMARRNNMQSILPTIVEANQVTIGRQQLETIFENYKQATSSSKLNTESSIELVTLFKAIRVVQLNSK